MSSLKSKITENKTKNGSIEDELNKLTKLKVFDLGYFIGKSHFDEDGAQIHLIFQTLYRYFKLVANTDYVSS